ncbi:hypothetical protein U9M48_001068 [Paspalum notatum var. saurae]|uniref:F-box domain-containing protein n=1 Tax=Paspalum notatum var. saurae TaxID=547442 RepID=A0AAQ3PFW5_PASNO
MHKRVEGEATVKEVGGAPTHKDCPMEAHSKLKRDDNDDGFLADDRLSTLPDCLLHEIMSYLKLQELVQTSMLSKRWMPLWRSMTSLNVDQEEFKVAANALMAVKCNTARELVEWVKFEKFTDHLLIRHNVDAALLISFRLHISNSSRGEQAARWIRHLIKYGSAMVPGTPWNLKKLHISNVNLDGRLSEHMRSRCPSLVDLELKGCKCEMYEIASDSLKKLVLEDCDFRGLAAITTPKLESFAFNGGRITGKCSLVIMAPAVDDVAMSVSNSAAGVHLHGVSNVTRLDLSCIVVVALTEEFAQFNNLRDLSLKDYCRLTDSFEKLLEQFIWSSPNLENLNVCRCKEANRHTSFSATYVDEDLFCRVYGHRRYPQQEEAHDN